VIITRKPIDRRTVLRGIGTALALPFLDAMAPLKAAARKAATKRLGVIYVPNGMVMEHWTPSSEGLLTDLPSILQPLDPFKQSLSVISGLSSKEGFAGTHAYAATMFMTGLPPKTTRGAAVQAGISMDQLAARELGRGTQLPSLELSLESSEQAGTCADNLSCSYSNTIAWRSPTMPLTTENNPRAVFERLFGDSNSTEPGYQLARIAEKRSLLDSVSEKIAGFESGLGSADRARLSEYIEAVREVERRLEKAEAQSRSGEAVATNQPYGIPESYEEHAKLMYDLQVLAYQSDVTRVITFMVGHELSGQTYPQIGVPDPHHPISHHQNDPDKLEKLIKINTYHIGLFAYYLKKLSEVRDADGTLLDSLLLLYGGGISNSQMHSPDNLPIVVVGGGRRQGAMHYRYPGTTPLTNLHLTLLDKLGAPVDRMGLSTGELTGLSI
jgi:uncharacterized protein DUF1552